MFLFSLERGGNMMTVSRKDSKGRVLRKGESVRQNGTYSYAYTDKYGKRRTIYAKTLQDLRKQEDSLTKDVLDGIDAFAAKDVSLNDLFDRWIKTKTKLRPSTMTNYTYMYNTFVRNKIGKFSIGRIKHSDMIAFYQELIDSRLALNTLDVIQTVLHPMFDMAVNDNIIRTNPTNGLMRKFREGEDRFKGVRRALTKEQQRAFMTFCRESKRYSKWVPILTTLLGTGCRVGEVIGLRWQDVDFDKREISINHTVSDHVVYGDRGRTIYGFRVSLPKTRAGIRAVPMMDAVYDVLVQERDRQSKTGFNTTVIDGMSGFIFSNRYGNVISAKNINGAIKRISRDYNAIEKMRAEQEGREPVFLPTFSCHHLRHTFCTRFFEVEQNFKVIQEIMGHADITTTMDIYTEITSASKSSAIRNLSKSIDVF